jgi:two-component system phosphate regulon response regulator PhoB
MTQDFLPTPERPGRVLIVDDNALDLEFLSAQLKGHAFQLTLTRSAKDALTLADQVTFEAILSDISMPGMDGLELCRRLRSTQNARTPFMFLTAHRAGEESVAKGLDAGALDYLVKPYALPELVAKLRVMVRLSRQQAALAASERQEALLEITGGAAHELSQPLAAAQLLFDRLERQKTHPSVEQMAQLRDLLNRAANILGQIQGLSVYVTKPYATGQIMDVEKSHEASGAHIAIQRSAGDWGSE